MGLQSTLGRKSHPHFAIPPRHPTQGCSYYSSVNQLCPKKFPSLNFQRSFHVRDIVLTGDDPALYVIERFSWSFALKVNFGGSIVSLFSLNKFCTSSRIVLGLQEKASILSSTYLGTYSEYCSPFHSNTAHLLLGRYS